VILDEPTAALGSASRTRCWSWSKQSTHGALSVILYKPHMPQVFELTKPDPGPQGGKTRRRGEDARRTWSRSCGLMTGAGSRQPLDDAAAVGFAFWIGVERYVFGPAITIPLWKWGRKSGWSGWRVRGRPFCAERCLQRADANQLAKRPPRRNMRPAPMISESGAVPSHGRISAGTAPGRRPYPDWPCPTQRAPLAGRDGGTTPVPDLGALARVGRFVGLVQPD